MRNLRMNRKPAIGIGIAAIVAVLCLSALASDSARIEKPAAVDAEQYADFIENEVFDIQDLAEGAEIQRRRFNRMTPPGFSWVQPMFPSVVPFDAENFDEKFLDELLGEDKNSVAIYPLSLIQDPQTRETLIYNADGKLITTIPADRVSREWPENADPARVTLQLDLLPSEDVEPYLYTESRIAEYEEARTAKTKKSGGMVLRSLGASEFGIAGVQRLTNGNTQITVTNGTDAAEVFAYTVWHTSSVSVVVWTNEFDEVLTNSHTAWHPVSPSFDGIESAWECLSTNLPLISGVGVYEDADIPDNARVRFYAVVKLMDTDGDGLSDGAEILVYRTDPDNPDSDGDGLSDYDEVITYGTNPNDPDSDGDGLPDAWEVQHGLDPLDDGSGNIDNGPEGDPDGDGFSNSLELELGSPPDNPAWNGHQLAYRLTHARVNNRSITNDLIGLRVNIDDSSDCGGSAGTQNRTDSLYVPKLLDCGYFIDITVEGMVEDVDVNYDKVSIEAFTNTFYFSGSSNRPSECRMISKTKTCNVFIKGNSTVYLRYNTVSYKWHSGAYAEIIGAELTGTLNVEFDVLEWEPYLRDAGSHFVNIYPAPPNHYATSLPDLFTGDTFELFAKVKILSDPACSCSASDACCSEWKARIFQNIVAHTNHTIQWTTNYVQYSPSSIPAYDPVENEESFTACEQEINLSVADSPGDTLCPLWWPLSGKPNNPLTRITRDTTFVTWLAAENTSAERIEYLKWVKWRVAYDVSYEVSLTNVATTLNSWAFQIIDQGDGMGSHSPSFTGFSETATHYPIP